ncbi:hypothetical protein GVN21_00525 [Caulobacter sp. SLTY]|uniref:LptA/OstA family protein n=1 Tax=Caulobacter sp. SLTY TaxID=2683262 RepID=UPI001411B651|nr:LptA/OstA family protein [Caulobacter sp. SLTY]NBB13835.1 hypothetical protein [Caulobacter sp. SLTY]
MRKARYMAAAGALVGVMVVAGAAQAQIAPRSKAPLDIAADESEILTNECKSIWRGDVEALQARTRLRAQTLNVFAAKKGGECGETERLVAEGQVYYVEGERKVRADNAVYTSRAETITLTGDVVVTEGQNVARADRVVINLQTGQSQMFSNSKGRGGKNRVRAVLYPSGKPQ